MIVRPETFADRGCWISDDRVYAFVSSAIHGIAEIGYHGSQPASRNARVFVSAAGVLRFSVVNEAGVQRQLAFSDYEWSPRTMTLRGSSVTGSVELEVRGLGRNIQIGVTELDGDISSFVVTLNKSSFFSDVHGRRTWSTLPGEPGWVKLQFRDRILLDEWMKRESPYGSDFLIPEPVRRRIFRRRVRSGLATAADLLQEFQNSPLPIYDAQVRIDIGGDGYGVIDEGETFSFSTLKSGSLFMVSFDADEDVHVKGGVSKRGVVRDPAVLLGMPAAVPTISLPGFEHITEFFSIVPGLVESCVIQDVGVPRATPGGYYWIWAWDAMVTAIASLRWGGLEIAERTASFVESHRDEGCIPMRWTHSLEPLDTQPRGALESLLASLTYAITRERQRRAVSPASYSSMVQHLKAVADTCDRRGLFPNIGFYPDLPLRFGRTEESVVAMEAAAFYSFCRICENCALQMEDQDTMRVAVKIKAALEHSFGEVFWDKPRQFFVDAVETRSGLRNMSFPLFSLLFLHYPPAIQLIRAYTAQSAEFIKRHLLTRIGVRMLPAWDRNSGSETVSNSWYPHWDIYALRLLRRAGHAAEISTWLQSVEMTLERLGYAPEYLLLAPLLAKDPQAYLHHGSASNLNCVTGWYQALLEGVMGLEFDPGGLTMVPLALPLEESSVEGVHHLGTRWNIKARHAGPQLMEVRLDGELLEGCLKIPMRHHDGGDHTIELVYGQGVPGPRFLEITNAEVLEVASSPQGVEVVLNALGQLDLVFSAPDDWKLFADARHVAAARIGREGPRWVSLQVSGKHTLLISPPR
jgi:hypothetical protein